MAKNVLHRLKLAASKRLKHMQTAAAKAAEEALEKRYVRTAEQTLRGAASVAKILRENDADIAKAKGPVVRKPVAKKPPKRKPKSKVSKQSATKAVKRKTR